MLGNLLPPLWAVHISDGVLTPLWLAGGFAGAAALAFVGAWRIRDEEIPKVALLTAAFFVASLMRVPVAGVTSAHLLLNGLMGVVLGRRAALAIPVGLFLQAALTGHGGFSALGVNSCVMTIPALLAWQLFALLRRVPWVRRPWFRSGLVVFSTLVWVLSLVYGGTLLWLSLGSRGTLFANHVMLARCLDGAWANTSHPVTLAAALAVAALVAWAERRLENAPEFPVGLLVGELAVLATVLLHCLVLVWGGQEDWQTLALVSFVLHLPIAVVEGTVLGFTVGFLVRVKPELLGWEDAADVGVPPEGGVRPTPPEGGTPALGSRPAEDGRVSETPPGLPCPAAFPGDPAALEP
jgi:cobalt/nickel transport system permease protein